MYFTNARISSAACSMSSTKARGSWRTAFVKRCAPVIWREQHLHRYLAEFEFRYNNQATNGVDDAARAASALTGLKGKRLMYRDSSWARCQ